MKLARNAFWLIPSASSAAKNILAAYLQPGATMAGRKGTHDARSKNGELES